MASRWSCSRSTNRASASSSGIGRPASRSFKPDWTRETGNQLALAFECSSPSEVDEVYRRVVDAGFHGEKEPWDAFWGQRYAQLQDPDGNSVDLFAAL